MKKIISVVCIIIIVVIGYVIISSYTKSKNSTALSNTINEIEDNVIVEKTQDREVENNVGLLKNTNQKEENMQSINIKIEDKNFTAILYDNSVTRELTKQMPFTINMNELHGNEKYYYFDQNFETTSQKVEKIKNGELMLYGSNCLVLFYEDVSNNYDYTRLGKIENPSELKSAVGNGNVQVTFSIKE